MKQCDPFRYDRTLSRPSIRTLRLRLTLEIVLIVFIGIAALRLHQLLSATIH